MDQIKVVKKRTHIAVVRDGEVLGAFTGPNAEGHATVFRAALTNIPEAAELIASIDNEFRRGFIDGQVQMRDEYAGLRLAVEAILDAGHMNTEDLVRLRAAWEKA